MAGKGTRADEASHLQERACLLHARLYARSSEKARRKVEDALDCAKVAGEGGVEDFNEFCAQQHQYDLVLCEVKSRMNAAAWVKPPHAILQFALQFA